MPRRTDIQTILVLGSGPIVIGQACEFDYSGTQAIKALRAEGYRVVLVNSNPATIMTDPEFADRTYIEPLTARVVEQVIERERPQALLPTLGGQTALNIAVELAESGVLEKYGVQMLGAQLPAIQKAEDRKLFKEAMERIGLELPRSGYATSLEEATAIAEEIGFPIILRPSFTLGGLGGATCYSMEEFLPAAKNGLDLSPTHTILVEESIAGWKEYEIEVVRDLADNVIIVCSIENVDPMGVHTGDSITVAPQQTLSSAEYARMREASRRIIREIGVESGGANVQFAVDPRNGRMVVIEMNPRVSRSSALASKATGYPIAKVAAKLAVGYTLDEIQNELAEGTPAAFEPSLDYVAVKIPRFTFEKFAKADRTLNTSMKSVGEAMAMGRTFQEAFQKALRSLEVGSFGLESPFGKDPGSSTAGSYSDEERTEIEENLTVPGPDRIWYLAEAFRAGYSLEEVQKLSLFDPWFLREFQEIVKAEQAFSELAHNSSSIHEVGVEKVRKLKQMGFSDQRLAKLANVPEEAFRAQRVAAGIVPVFKKVDTCAGRFDAYTPYFYSSYDEECEAEPTDRKKILILGGGPNRIGQGIEFDYCCVHAAFSLKEAGFETIMVNCNPETVSTDYDTADRLYFEPLTHEDVLAIWEREKPVGAIVQFGGQTPLKLAAGLARAGVRILGTSDDAIDIAEDRERFTDFINSLNLKQPDHGAARSREEAHTIALRIGYPVMVRPSYVLGGRAMEIIHSADQLDRYIKEAVRVSETRPVLIDRFLRNATEVDVDCLSDGSDVIVGGVMEHIEEAGIHSGDSACVLPPHTLPQHLEREIERQTELMARKLGVVGLMNVQFAIEGEEVYVLEVNPRASRTAPFVSKATGLPLAKAAALIQAGIGLKEQKLVGENARAPGRPKHFSVKESVFPFGRFTHTDTILGPEMRSTGEVMGVAQTYAAAFGKAQEAAGNTLPEGGNVFVSVRDEDKPDTLNLARRLVELGFSLVATKGTAAYLDANGVPVKSVNKVAEGSPHIVDLLKEGGVDFVVNTTSGLKAIEDSHSIRQETLHQRLPYSTTLEGARAALAAMEAMKEADPGVKSIQEHHEN